MRKKLLLGVAGDVGSFSEEAGLLYSARVGQKFSLAYLLDMEGVLAAVAAAKVDRGIFPVINFRGGLVKAAFEAMGRYSFILLDEVWLDIQQCLLVKPGTQSKQIKKIASYPQAIAQCERYLCKEFKNTELIAWGDTAKAARDLAEGKLAKSYAVIASERSAGIYGLQVLAKNIQDNNPNLTVFIVVKKLL